MFGFECNEQEERKALLETGEERGEARGRAIGEAHGRTIGEAHGKLLGTIASIKNLMKSMNWSAEDAMKAIGIAPSEYKQYMAML